MRSESKESGNVTLYIVVAVIAAALLVGGIYLLKHKSQTANNGPIATEQTEQTDVNQNQNQPQPQPQPQQTEASQTEGSTDEEQSTEQNATESQSDQSSQPNQMEPEQQTTETAPSAMADTGPTEIAATGGIDILTTILSISGIFAVTYAVYFYWKSERDLATAMLKR